MTQNSTEIDPLAGGEKRASISFKGAEIGKTFAGKVVQAPQLVQSRDFESGELATWPDGNPKMTVVVTLEINGEELNLWAGKPGAMFTALREAQQRLGRRISVGDTLTVKYTGEKPNEKNPRLNPQKLYAVKVEAGDVFADDAPPF